MCIISTLGGWVRAVGSSSSRQCTDMSGSIIQCNNMACIYRRRGPVLLEGVREVLLGPLLLPDTVPLEVVDTEL